MTPNGRDADGELIAAFGVLFPECESGLLANRRQQSQERGVTRGRSRTTGLIRTSDHTGNLLLIGKVTQFRVLEGRMDEDLMGKGEAFFDGGGYGMGVRYSLAAGLPRFDKATFTGRFPYAQVQLDNQTFPVTAVLEGWSPFIPGNTDDSSLPLCGGNDRVPWGESIKFRTGGNKTAGSSVLSFEGCTRILANLRRFCLVSNCSDGQLPPATIRSP